MSMFQARLLTKPLARKGLPDILNDQVSRADPSHVRDAVRDVAEDAGVCILQPGLQDVDTGTGLVHDKRRCPRR